MGGEGLLRPKVSARPSYFPSEMYPSFPNADRMLRFHEGFFLIFLLIRTLLRTQSFQSRYFASTGKQGDFFLYFLKWGIQFYLYD